MVRLLSVTLLIILIIILSKKIKTKSGFTLIETLAVIVIISVVFFIGYTSYTNYIKKSKENATSIAIDNIKKAADLFVKDKDNIKWNYKYKEIGENSYIIDKKYYCLTVQELINMGYLKKDFLKKEIYNDIDSNTFIQVVKNNNNSADYETKIMSSDTNKLQCENAIANNNIIDFGDEEIYTDRIKIDILSEKVDSFNCFYVKEENLNKDSIWSKGNNDNNKSCDFSKLINNKTYVIVACSTEDNGVCSNIISKNTMDFRDVKFEITDEDEWKERKPITITYYDDNIQSGQAVHYVYANFNGKVMDGVIYECDDQKQCEKSVDKIVAGTIYKVEGSEIKINPTDVIDEDGKNIYAKICDGSDNCKEFSKKVTKVNPIRTVTISFDYNGADNSNISSLSCQYDVNKTTSCSITLPTISRGDSYSILGWNLNAGDESASWSANSSASFNESKTIYAVTSKKVYAYFNYIKGAHLWNSGNVDSGQKYKTVSCTKYNTASSCSVTAPKLNNINAKTFCGQSYSNLFNVDGWSTVSGSNSVSVSNNGSVNISSDVNYYSVITAKSEYVNKSNKLRVYAYTHNGEKSPPYKNVINRTAAKESAKMQKNGNDWYVKEGSYINWTGEWAVNETNWLSNKDRDPKSWLYLVGKGVCSATKCCGAGSTDYACPSSSVYIKAYQLKIK